MKKILLFLVVVATSTTFLSSCKKDSPVKGCTNADAINYDSKATEDDGTCIAPLQVKKTTFLDYTATWCGSCSSYGIPAFDQGIKDNPTKVVPLGLHQQDEMSNTISEGFAAFYNVSGIPTLTVGNNHGVSADANSINSAVTSNTSGAATTGLCAKVTPNGNSLSINARVKFYSALTGEYWLAVYPMENGLVYHQINLNDPFTHNHVLRGIANQVGGIRGEKIVTTSVAAGTIIDKSYTFNVTASGAHVANMYVSLVLWKNTAGTWTVENAW